MNDPSTLQVDKHFFLKILGAYLWVHEINPKELYFYADLIDALRSSSNDTERSSDIIAELIAMENGDHHDVTIARDDDRAIKRSKQRDDVTSSRDDVQSFDFEALYNKYPRKEGKTMGLKRCKIQIKTQEQYDQLSLAIDKYAKHCTENTQLIKHFSSFMGTKVSGYPWHDWLDQDTGSVIKGKSNTDLWFEQKLAEEEAKEKSKATKMVDEDVF